jgi:multicomponent Na+:H+ antiporter subunit B
MKLRELKNKFFRWLDGDYDVMANIMDGSLEPDENHEQVKRDRRAAHEEMTSSGLSQAVISAERKGFYQFYTGVAIVSCIALIGVLLFTVNLLPRYGEENPRAVEVSDRYVEKGLEETGAVNIVAGMILDYRAFDTLGESHVLFAALLCVMILLKKDKKNMDSQFDDYYQIEQDAYFDVSKDTVMRKVGVLIIPCIFVFGIYILLNGQNGPGGGFSGGAVLGAGLHVCTC